MGGSSGRGGMGGMVFMIISRASNSPCVCFRASRMTGVSGWEANLGCSNKAMSSLKGLVNKLILMLLSLRKVSCASHAIV